MDSDCATEGFSADWSRLIPAPAATAAVPTLRKSRRENFDLELWDWDFSMQAILYQSVNIG
jgi:hypothetical protein